MENNNGKKMMTVGIIRRLQANNVSGFNGVDYDKKKQKWQARIQVNGKRKLVGRFNTKVEAIVARQKANVEYGFHENHG